MKRWGLLMFLFVACAPKKAPAPPPTEADHLAVEAVLWSAEKSDVDPVKVISKEGVLKKTAPPEGEEDQTAWWPWELDYWGIMRTDIGDVLAPYLGRRVRVEGEFRKTYAHDKWIYEVAPVRIVLLPNP